MTPLELLQSKRLHVDRLANEGGAAGETIALGEMDHWIRRPTGEGLKLLLDALEKRQTPIKRTSFDAVHIPGASDFDFTDVNKLEDVLPEMTFIEIKTANQERVKPDFSGFFFALTEGELMAAQVLGNRYRVALFNKRTGSILLTSVSDILTRSRSMNWQVSVQL